MPVLDLLDFDAQTEEQSSFGIGSKDDFQQAQWLAIKLKNEWRYDHTAQRWHHWDGSRWAPDETNRISHTVALTAAKAMFDSTNRVPKDTLTKLFNTQPQKRALEALATFPGYSTNGDDWDSDPYLLGVQGGIVDLRKNALVSADPTMLVTKTTGVKFKPVTSPSEFRERAPRFMEVMDEWTSSDPEMVAFLLRWFGAGLFGFSPEQRFLLMTGIGRNGKGALKHAVMCATGEYAAQFDSNLYMRSKFGAARSDAARADLVALKGKRITFFSEPEGGHFNEELLKAHTGGDKITARALYSNNIQSWDPTHSITFLVNDAPEVDDLGPSMGARVMVADFRERFDGEREDKTLYDTLKSERAGILAILCWAAASWYKRYNDERQGIPLPERVREQSQRFMERNDPVAAFIDEACNTGVDLRGNGRLLYDAYVDWHKHAGRDGDAMSNVKFSQVLEKKGFRRTKTNTANVWTGIKPKGATELMYDDDEE